MDQSPIPKRKLAPASIDMFSRDAWVLNVEVFEEFALADKNPIKSGHRPAFMTQGLSSSIRAVRKTDTDYPGALWDKVASDLAAMLKLPVSPSLLAKDAEGRIMVYQQAPAKYRTSLHDAKESFPGFVEKAIPLYPHEIIAFDLFIGNWDRHAGNFLFCESPNEPDRIFAIDHGFCFGCDGNGASSWAKNETVIEIVANQYSDEYCPNIDKSRVLKCSRDIADLPKNLIKEVVLRAAEFYGSDEIMKQAEAIVPHLEARANSIVEYVEKKI